LKARNSRVEIEYEGVDITTDVAPFLLGFTYNDNLDEFDDIEITLDDRDGNWLQDWQPQKGDRITATIVLENWDGEEGEISLPCGTFEIDNPTFSGPPDVLTLRGISVPLSLNMADEKKNKAWENITFSKIISELGENLDLETMLETSWNGYFDRLEMKDESYWNFLKKICSENGISVKVFNSTIVVFDEAEYESSDGTFTITKDICKSYSFSDDDTDTYLKSRVTYTDPVLGEKIEKTFTASDRSRYREETGRELVLKERASVPGESVTEKELNTERKAKKILRNKNKNTLTGDFEIFYPSSFISAGLTCDVSGFGMYEGKYIITKASHKLGNGYQVSLQARECLEGY